MMLTYIKVLKYQTNENVKYAQNLIFKDLY